MFRVEDHFMTRASQIVNSVASEKPVSVDDKGPFPLSHFLPPPSPSVISGDSRSRCFVYFKGKS